jgi:hypothetical protein
MRIAFLGQCHTYGYEGVPPDAAFPQVCRAAVQARRPGVLVDVVVEEYHHPAQLERAVIAALRTRPRIVVIEVVGWLTVKGSGAVDLSRLPVRVSSAVQRVQHFRRVSQSLIAKLPKPVENVPFHAFRLASSILGSAAPRHLRTSINDYAAGLQHAIARVKESSGIDCVIQGPGAPNLSMSSRLLSANVIERYREVEAMARGVAQTNGSLYVDRWDTVSSSFYRPNSIRPTSEAHSTWGHLLAHELIAAGLV